MSHKTDEVIAVGEVDDYATDHQNAKKIGIKFTLKERLPLKDKDTTYTKYLYDKGENHRLFNLDGKFSHIYVIAHNKETKEIDPYAIKKLESSGYKYRIDTTSDYSKRPTVYQQKYKVIKAVKSSLTLLIESAFSSTRSIEYLLQSFQIWFKSHFHQAKIVGNSNFYHDKVEIQVSNKGNNLLVKFIPVS